MGFKYPSSGEITNLMCHGDTFHKYYTPLQIVDVSNGCEAFSANIYIPAKSELMATLQSITRSQFSLDFNLKYNNICNFLVWYDFKFAELTEAEVKTLKAKMLQLSAMPMDMFKKIIENKVKTTLLVFHLKLL